MNARLSLASTNAPGGAATSSATASAEDPNRRLAGLLLELARCINPEMAATLPPPPQVDPRMEAMRDVLMQREKEALARLQKKIDDPREFAEAIGAVLPAAFTVAAGQDGQLAQVLAPTVERATQASIRKNPGTMVDILYPVMGPAIRKAIAETLEGTLQSLNQAIKYSLSWRGLKWRIEAWRSGSSFADVVLRHTAVFQVDHLFLAENDVVNRVPGAPDGLKRRFRVPDDGFVEGGRRFGVDDPDAGLLEDQRQGVGEEDVAEDARFDEF